MPTIKCLIVDDEPLARKLMAGHVEKLPEWEIMGVCKNAVKAYEILVRCSVHVLFLDINMPVISGIDFYRSLKNPPHLVFTTAYPEYAVEGFELEAVDYLVKPITFERFLATAERLGQRLKRPVNDFFRQKTANRNFLFVKHFSKLVKVSFNTILYIEAQKDFVHFALKADRLLAAMTMKQAEELLPEADFIRVHRSYIVSVHAVTALFGNVIEVGMVQLPIGGNYKGKVMERLQGKSL